jgi:hypothetical protein
VLITLPKFKLQTYKQVKLSLKKRKQMTTPKLDLVFERWKAALSKKDKRRDSVDGNFDELFDALKKEGASLDEVRIILPDAIKAHLPNAVVSKFTWNTVRKDPRYAGLTEKEFLKEWYQGIADQASNSMFIFFPIPEGGDDDGTPKIYGGGKVSAREFALQRAHADSFEILDFDDLNEDNDSEFVNEDEMLDILEGKKE